MGGELVAPDAVRAELGPGGSPAVDRAAEIQVRHFEAEELPDDLAEELIELGRA